MFGEDAGHAGERSFRDFFRLPTDEGESQAVGGLCVSFVEEVRECAVRTRSSFLFGTAFSDVFARTGNPQ
jgi:hypothetical protein